MTKKIIFSILISFFLFSGFVFAQKSDLYDDLDNLESVLQELLNLLDFDIDDTPLQPSTTNGVPSSFFFGRNMSRGDRGEHVMYLQMVLNMDTATKVSEIGAGSPGNETQFFGPATFDAVRRFQQKYKSEVLTPINLSIPTGYVGEMTRRKLNKILRGEFIIVPSEPPNVPPLPTPDPDPIPDPIPDSDPDPIPDSDPDPIPDPEPDPPIGQDNPCEGRATITDRRNQQIYNIVEIGSQCWMAENMNYSVGGSWCYRDNEENCKTYGRLYNFEATKDVCPHGYRLPTDDDFKILEREAGLSQTEANESGWRGENEGLRLKAEVGWDGSQGIGFSALPAGGREGSGSYSGISIGTSFWTSTESGSRAWVRQLYSTFSRVNRSLLPKDTAISVRCIKN